MQKHFSIWDLKTTFQEKERRGISLECFPFSSTEVIAEKKKDLDVQGRFFSSSVCIGSWGRKPCILSLVDPISGPAHRAGKLVFARRPLALKALTRWWMLSLKVHSCVEASLTLNYWASMLWDVLLVSWLWVTLWPSLTPQTTLPNKHKLHIAEI